MYNLLLQLTFATTGFRQEFQRKMHIGLLLNITTKN